VWRPVIPLNASIHLDEGSLLGEHDQMLTLPGPEALADKRDAFRQQLQDLAQADRDYDALPDSHGGRLLSTDNARHLQPDYHASWSGRMKWTKATSAPARAYIQ